ncbi:BMP family ABC transporter substrate-binding protein [Candidatus Bipolaricaulota bacterium]|nr:BMP family ABC transporter substrate-binding protein [Candidatus Bipolaricaulota bacterium]
MAKKTKLLVFILSLGIILSGFSAAILAQSEDTLKAGFIYVGPVGDYGYSKAHDEGRKYVEEAFPWLETFYAENVLPPDVESTIDTFVKKKNADVIFTTSFGHMDPTARSAEKYPDTIFFHCSGYKRAENLGTYFAGLYQTYYLSGLMAGALTESDKLGYIAVNSTPEVKRHINAFAIGINEVNPEATLHPRWLMDPDWVDPQGAKEATEALIEEGVDVFAYTEDTPATLQAAEENGALSFAHYNPMYRFAEEGTLSGQVANWGPIYADILYKVRNGIYTNKNLENVDYWWLMKENAAKLQAKPGMMINDKYIDDLKSVKVEDPILGEISVYELIMKRIEQMKSSRVTFDPYVGPMKDRQGIQRLKDGEWASHDKLWTMQWAFNNIKGPWPDEPKE